jgi:hypothetical protein
MEQHTINNNPDEKKTTPEQYKKNVKWNVRTHITSQIDKPTSVKNKKERQTITNSHKITTVLQKSNMHISEAYK